MPKITVSYSIPYICQFASPDLVADFVYDRFPLESDPRWAEYGAQSPEEYAHWAKRSCGVVCVKMAVEGITQQGSRSIMSWVRQGLSLDGYLTEIRADRPVEKGWKHASLAELAQANGCSSKLVAELTIGGLAEHVRQDRLVIASVSSELGEDGPITRSSGHLVVVYGMEVREGGEIKGVRLHNPSGRSPMLQAEALIPAARFVAAFSGRGITIGKPRTESPPAPNRPSGSESTRSLH